MNAPQSQTRNETPTGESTTWDEPRLSALRDAVGTWIDGDDLDSWFAAWDQPPRSAVDVLSKIHRMRHEQGIQSPMSLLLALFDRSIEELEEQGTLEGDGKFLSNRIACSITGLSESTIRRYMNLGKIAYCRSSDTGYVILAVEGLRWLMERVASGEAERDRRDHVANRFRKATDSNEKHGNDTSRAAVGTTSGVAESTGATRDDDWVPARALGLAVGIKSNSLSKIYDAIAQMRVRRPDVGTRKNPETNITEVRPRATLTALRELGLIRNIPSDESSVARIIDQARKIHIVSRKELANLAFHQRAAGNNEERSAGERKETPEDPWITVSCLRRTLGIRSTDTRIYHAASANNLTRRAEFTRRLEVRARSLFVLGRSIGWPEVPSNEAAWPAIFASARTFESSGIQTATTHDSENGSEGMSAAWSGESGKKFRMLREACGVSRVQMVASTAGAISTSWLDRFERGDEMPYIGRQKRRAVAAALGLEIGDLNNYLRSNLSLGSALQRRDISTAKSSDDRRASNSSSVATKPNMQTPVQSPSQAPVKTPRPSAQAAKPPTRTAPPPATAPIYAAPLAPKKATENGSNREKIDAIDQMVAKGWITPDRAYVMIRELLGMDGSSR